MTDRERKLYAVFMIVIVVVAWINAFGVIHDGNETGRAAMTNSTPGDQPG